MKILDRYLLREILGPFMIGILGFILVLIVDLLFTFVDLIINRGVPLGAIAKLLLFKLPSILVLTYPVATLFGVAMALGRLSKDNEINALRTSGVTFFRISVPILVLGLMVSLLSYITNEKIAPYANHVSENIIRSIVLKQPLPEIRENIFFKDAYNRYFYIQKFDTRTKNLENIMVYEINGEKLPSVMTAQRAQLNNLILTLKEGIIHKFDEKGFLSYEANFAEMVLNLNEDPLTASNQKTTIEMNSRELSSQIKALEKGGVSTSALRTDLFMKFSVPFTCLIFALIGLPLSLPGIRGSRTWGLVLTIVIMFTFYVFASVFRSLGRGGLLTPLMAAWTPQILFGMLGTFLLFREGNYK